ncbi:hypothetical protein LTR17_027884, partial [Elasticomyces elasticus]
MERLVVGNVSGRLEEGRLEDVEEFGGDCRVKGRMLGNWRPRVGDMRRRIRWFMEPKQVEKVSGAALSQAAQAQQSELRLGVQKVQKMLVQVEETMTLLRAELAGPAARYVSAVGGSAAAVPTSEAVTNTILMLPAMTELKSGDIDVLESLMQKLPDDVASLPKLDVDYEDQLVASWRG